MRKMYSQNQIKNLVQEAITEGQIEIPQELPSQEGAEVGDVLKIGESGLEWGAGGGGSPVAYEGTSAMPSDVVFESWTLHRAIQEGNILWFVLSGAITNIGAEKQNIFNIFEVTLPSEISSKIYRYDSTTCDDSYHTNNVILVNYFNNKQMGLSSNYANEIILGLRFSLPIEPLETVQFDVRIPIFLDLGEVAE